MNKQEFVELQKKFSDETKKRKIFKLLNIITTFISILGISVLTYYFVNTIFKKETISEYQTLKSENQYLKKSLQALKIKLEKNNTLKDTGITKSSRIEILEQKIENLNKIILEDPEKSLTIPLLNKEIENQKSNTEIKIEFLKDKVETVIELNKWILGLIFSLLVTIIIANVFNFNFKKDIINTEG